MINRVHVSPKDCYYINQRIDGTDKYFTSPFVSPTEVFTSSILADDSSASRNNSIKMSNSPKKSKSELDDDNVQIIGVKISPQTQQSPRMAPKTINSVKFITNISSNQSNGEKTISAPKIGSSNVGEQVQVQESSDNKSTHFLKRKSTPKKAKLDAVPFTWELYQKSTVPYEEFNFAPKTAFMQSQEPLTNDFDLNMKLEAKDPRNESSWCLATVISKEGLRIGLRLDGSDNKNDFYELVDSDNIRPIIPRRYIYEPLLPPFGYTGDISNYSHFVEKTLLKPGTILAPETCFKPKPKSPARNMFQVGMKLEAIDRKNPLFICPATIVDVTCDLVRIIFDGWSESYGYTCTYYSRDLFYVNWCRDTNHRLSAPKGWERFLINGQPLVDMSRYLPDSDGRRPTTPGGSKPRGRPKTRSPTTRHRTPIKKIKIKRKSHGSIKLDRRPQTSIGKRAGSLDTEIKPQFETQPKPATLTQETNTRIQNTPSPDEATFSCQRTKPITEWRLNEKNRYSSALGLVEPSDQSKSEPSSQADTVKSLDIMNSSQNLDQSSGSIAKTDQIASPPVSSNASEKPDMPNQVIDWTITDVLNYLSTDEALSKYSQAFMDAEIDGRAFLLLEPEFMIKFMDIKVGPALKIQKLIDLAKKQDESCSS